MKIPRRIEWRAGVALVASSISLMGLLIALILVRVDVGMELKSSLRQTHHGWTLRFELPVESLDLLRRCRQVRLSGSDHHEWYTPISTISGQWDPEKGKMITRIALASKPPPWTAEAGSTASTVQVMLVESRRVPVLKALFASVLPSPQG